MPLGATAGSRLSRQRWTNSWTEEIACFTREVAVAEVISTSMRKCSKSRSGESSFSTASR
jgi:hypothetical protein